MRGSDHPDIAGNETVIAKLAIHCAPAATPRALPRMRLGKISPSSTQTSGPQEAPKPTTKTFAATRATPPHGAGSETFSPEPVAKANERAIAPSETVISTEPVRRMGLRPTLSTRKIATNVTTTLVTEVMTEISSELLSSKPTAFHRVVE